MNNPLQEAAIRQNLQDAGFDADTTRQCMALWQARQCAQMLQLLAAHRASLLHAIHSSQYKLDCLDYLLYQIKKEMEGRLL